MTNVLEMKNVTWGRDGKEVLRNINWSVKPGEHWALFGLNGSGKTTLLNMLNGYIWPSEGEVYVLGHKLGEVDMRQLRKSIGWVSSSLQEKLYGSEKSQDIVVSGKFASFGIYEELMEEDYIKAAEWMERLGCSHLKGRSYQTCSQGEKQKLLIARAMMAQPKLLILDEACNGLDFISKENLLNSLGELLKEADAPHMVYVTHHTEEILPEIGHTLLLRNGEVFASGSTGEMFSGGVLSSFFSLPVDVNWSHNRAWLSRK